MGKINPEAEAIEPVFHADWERRVFGMTLATGMLGQWNIDEARHARERQEPADYLKHCYYENWLVGMETLLLEKDLIDESDSRAASQADDAAEKLTLRVPDSLAVKKILASGADSIMASDETPRFAVGESVLVKDNYSEGHTRVPEYVQGATGTIVKHLGCHIYPDANAHGERRGEPLYSVCFDGSDLWGPDSKNLEVIVDLWQPYLQPAD